MIETENNRFICEPLNRRPKVFIEINRFTVFVNQTREVKINTKALISMKVSQNGYAPKTKVK